MKHMRIFEQFRQGPTLITESASEGLMYHASNGIPLNENVYRMGSTKYFELFNEARALYEQGKLVVCDDDRWFLESDIGTTAEYEGETVYLDIPMLEAEYQGKTVKLNSPKRGGSKKFYVYVKNKKGKVIKVSFGAKSGGGSLSVKLKDPEAKANFAKRHDCENKNDKTKPGYWACRLPRYAKQLGLSGGGKWW